MAGAGPGRGTAGVTAGLGPAAVLGKGEGPAGVHHQRSNRDRGHEAGIPQRVQGAALSDPDGRPLRVVGEPGGREVGPVVHPCRHAALGRRPLGGRQQAAWRGQPRHVHRNHERHQRCVSRHPRPHAGVVGAGFGRRVDESGCGRGNGDATGQRAATHGSVPCQPGGQYPKK